MTEDYLEKKVAIVDYGCGNIGSVKNMFSKIEIWSEIVTSPDDLKNYDAIVLPGVGSFDNGVLRLKKSGFWDVIVSLVEQQQVPILGICLGMQLFFERSEEGVENGFGWIPGALQKFDNTLDRVPHMGWNEVEAVNKTGLIAPTKNEFYFVHSYHAPIDLPSDYCVAMCNYTLTYPAAVKRDNIVGFQFHPEKSLSNGMEVLKNWFEQIVMK